MRILAACSPGEIRVAVVDRALIDFAIWRPGRPDGVGDLHIGRVTARARALGGSFVALDGADGFLPDSEQSIVAAVGALIPVRVTRAAQGGKGPRLTAHASLDGAAIGPTRLVQRGPGAVERFATLYPDAAVTVDDPALAALLRPSLGARLHTAPRAFDDDLEDAVAALADEWVALPGGGGLRIQPTAALVAIDVDAGAALAGHTDKTVAHIDFNGAVVPELARQIRLRNLSGAILVDFAGLSIRRRALLGTPLRDALARDATDCRLLGFTGLGLAEIVRRRVHPPLHELNRGPHAAAAAALRACVAAARSTTLLVLRAAPDVVAAYQQDDVMRGDLARSIAHDLMVRSDPSLASCIWRLDEIDRSAR